MLGGAAESGLGRIATADAAMDCVPSPTGWAVAIGPERVGVRIAPGVTATPSTRALAAVHAECDRYPNPTATALPLPTVYAPELVNCPVVPCRPGQSAAILALMGRHLAACCLAAVSALAVTGCTVHGTAQPESGAPEAGPSVAPTTGAAPGEPISDLPPCGDIGTAATPPDCLLESRDSTGLSFEVRHTGNDGRTITTVTVLDASGARVQTLTEKDTGVPSGPRVRDLDADGRDELMIPLALADANTRYAVYRADDAGELRRAGELTGIGIDTSESGSTVVSARIGHASWDIEFWTFDADTLRALVTAEVRPTEDANGTVTGYTCTVADDGGLAGLGLSPDEATARFCTEPAVGRVMR
ncbi:hypothetical protein [Nocardia crassostreae]|uniref:hypothetical protein n=1 Tax=Nocardia crassostreae TaxID=53428 RepID=UPI00082BF93A|nr:hypothetical protein [Nocardia crassostreae]